MSTHHGRPVGPQFNPSVLVVQVQRLLGESGIAVVVDLTNAYTAITAAADLLCALHVEPATAPLIQSPPRRSTPSTLRNAR